MTVRPLTFLPCGDTALSVQLGDTIERQLCVEVGQLKEAVERARLPGVVECVPTYCSLLVHYSPLQTSQDELKAALTELAAAGQTAARRAVRWRLPLCCDAAFAWDLDRISDEADLSRAEVERLLFETELFLYMTGFMMGLLYVGDFPRLARLSRRGDPRTAVDGGAVAVAQGLGVIYPVAGPGGWNVVGNTPVPLFNIDNTPPSPFTPGDIICFQQVDSVEHRRIVRAVESGDYHLQREEVS